MRLDSHAGVYCKRGMRAMNLPENEVTVEVGEVVRGGVVGGEWALVRVSRDLILGRPCTQPETLYHRDDALLYIAYVLLIWAAPIPTDRWH